MSNNTEIKEGSIVKCAFCQKETAVQFVNSYNGTEAFSLGCFHRNAVCPTCNQMAKDVSETISEVQKHCVNCDPAIEQEDDEE